MIKVTRGECPKSLKLPDPGQKAGPAVTTQTYRMEVIRRHLEGKPFPKGDSTYTDRYKQDDTKAALRDAFHDKCAYCENKQERMEVEHYRPTRKYPWLAYSWDNLLWACSTCNAKKRSSFTIKKQKAVFDAHSLTKIHALATEYADSEKPVLLNPTLDNLDNLFTYDQSGGIKGNETRSKYTVKRCRLDRLWLRDERKKVLDDFRILLESVLLIDNPEHAIRVAVHRFCADADNPEAPFTEFRKFAIKHLLSEIVFQVCNSHAQEQ